MNRLTVLASIYTITEIRLVISSIDTNYYRTSSLVTVKTHTQLIRVRESDSCEYDPCDRYDLSDIDLSDRCEYA